MSREDTLQLLLDLVQRIAERQDDMNSTLARNTASFEGYVQRTNDLEERQKMAESRLGGHDALINRLKGARWLVGIAVAGLAVAKTYGII